MVTWIALLGVVVLAGVFAVTANALAVYVVLDRMRQLSLLQRYCRMGGGRPRTDIGDSKFLLALFLLALVVVLIFGVEWLAVYIRVIPYVITHVMPTPYVLMLFIPLPGLIGFTIEAVITSVMLFGKERRPEVTCLPS
jgi:hypothetical protein